MKSKIIEGVVKYSKNGSGWFVVSVEKIQIDKATYDPVKGSSHIPLPKKIADKKALINMGNKDDQCFKYAVTRALNPVTRDAERITKELKKQASELNWNGVEFPTPCTERQFKTFEKNNNVSVLVSALRSDRSVQKGCPTIFSKNGKQLALLRRQKHVEVDRKSDER